MEPIAPLAPIQAANCASFATNAFRDGDLSMCVHSLPAEFPDPTASDVLALGSFLALGAELEAVRVFRVGRLLASGGLAPVADLCKIVRDSHSITKLRLDMSELCAYAMRE